MDLEWLTQHNHITLEQLHEALGQYIRGMILEDLCRYMESSTENLLRIRRLYYHTKDNRKAVQQAVSLVCHCVLPPPDLDWLDHCLHAFFRKGVTRCTVSPTERQRLWVSQHEKCAICGERLAHGKFHVDHKIPWDYVGDELKDNLQVLCDTCNRKKSNHATTAIHTLLCGGKGA